MKWRSLKGINMKLLLIGFCIMLVGCSSMQQVQQPTPTPEPPHLEIVAAQRSIHVGETITITATPHNMGVPTYTLTLSTGATAQVDYEGNGDLGKDAVFEIIDATPNGNSMVFTLKGVGAGQVDATVHVSGEWHTNPSVEPVNYYSAEDSKMVEIDVKP
jgi:hypothetical protein